MVVASFAVASLWHSSWHRCGIRRGIVVAFVVASLWHSSWHRCGIRRCIVVAFVVASLWHSSWHRCGIRRGIVVAFVVASLWHSLWHRCGIHRGIRRGIIASASLHSRQAPPGTQACAFDIKAFHQTCPVLPDHKPFLVVQFDGLFSYSTTVTLSAPAQAISSAGQICRAVVDIWNTETANDADIKGYEDDLSSLRFPNTDVGHWSSVEIAKPERPPQSMRATYAGTWRRSYDREKKLIYIESRLNPADRPSRGLASSSLPLHNRLKRLFPLPPDLAELFVTGAW
jgi:hypothetical protein